MVLFLKYKVRIQMWQLLLEPGYTQWGLQTMSMSISITSGLVRNAESQSQMDRHLHPGWVSVKLLGDASAVGLWARSS